MQGVQGLRGITGATGRSIVILGTLNSESELPVSAQIGDTYWVGTKLYTWTKNPSEGVAEGFLASPDLKGAQGIRGEKGDIGEGVKDLGTATLLTQAQTIRESINEVFQYGNDVKNQTVASLLSIDPTLPINSSSSWKEIQNAINNIQSGVTVIGDKSSLITYLDNLQIGEFIRYQEEFLAKDYFNGNSVSFGNHIKSTNVKVLGDKILVGREFSSEYAGVSLLEYKNDRVSLVRQITTSAFTRTGNDVSLIPLTKNKVIHLYPGTAGNNHRVYALNVNITEDGILSTTPYKLLSNVANSGFGMTGLRIRDDAFIVFHRNTGSGCVASTFRVNADNTYTLMSEVAISNVISNSFEAIYLDESSHKILLLGLSSADGSLTGKTLEVNPDNLEIRSLTSNSFNIKDGTNSGTGANAFITNRDENKIEVSIFHNHSQNNSIGLSVIEINTSNYTPVLPAKKYENIIKSANSGMTTSGNSRVSAKMHSETHMGNGIFLILYKNSLSTECAYIDIRQEIIVPYGIKSVKTDTASSNDLMLLDFGNRNYGALIQGGGANQGFSTIIPETNLRRASRVDCVGGVANNSGSFPSKIDITIPK